MSRGAARVVLGAALAALALAPPAHAEGVRATDVRAEAPLAEPPIPADVREPCASREPLRRPFFGDLHVHTALSLDASTQGTRNRPHDAYRFARGEEIGVQPYAADGRALRSLKLSRPLDFAAVTDHAELLGEAHICSTPGLEGHDSWMCRLYRNYPRAAFFVMNYQVSSGDAVEPPSRLGFCGPDGALCREAARSPWREIQDAAEAAYDRSAACRFTSFVGYEWTGAAGPGNNLHRNVIFANRIVPELPATFIDTPAPELLWQRLRDTCSGAGTGCDAIVIPHNSNLGGGMMFATSHADGTTMSTDEAQLAQDTERLVEVMQHKGSSECMRGVDTPDELCGFETLEMNSFSGRYVSFLAEKPVPRQFVRHILREGLVEEERLGVNPWKFGIVASTDTHLGASGAVDEDETYKGHGGAGTPARDALPVGLPDLGEFNPGGLAVIWAEENSRESLFAAMQRREVYGTSGPRMVVRLFGGYGYPEDACAKPDLAALGYASGVAMGGDVPAPQEPGSAPTFIVAAQRDPGTAEAPGAKLERIQLVKGWLDAGVPRERVIDIAGPNAAGADQLCAVFRDPEFDPNARAVWYARVLELPTPRWTARACDAVGVACPASGEVAEGFEACCDPKVPRTVQERAWTSPIWYAPSGEAP